MIVDPSSLWSGRRLGRFVLVLGCLAMPGRVALAAPLPEPAPEAIDALFAGQSKANSPGCALGVFRDGKMAFERGYGLADLNQNVPITPETVFYIASTSKQFTAFAIALLAERGALALDDPVRKHLPELPPWADGVTIDQLVHHTSGISDYLSLWDLSGRSYADDIPLRQAIELIGRQKTLAFPPGSAWAYSNSNYLLLAEIVARVTGTSLRAFAQEAMFAPLEMTATAFHDDATRVVPRRAEGYTPDGRGGFRIARSSFALVGDGGLLTTVRDLLKWDANFYDNRLGGGQAIIERVTSPGALAGGTPLTQPPYGFGLQSGSYRGMPVIEHGGGFIGFSAQLLRFPTEHLSIAVLCNDAATPAAVLATRVADLFLPENPAASPAPANASAPPAQVTVTRELLARWSGRYFIVPLGFVATIAMNGEALQISAGDQTVPLIPTSAETFRAPSSPLALRFSVDESGVPSLLLEGSGQQGPARRLDDLPPPTEGMMAPYTGRYASDELDSWLEIRVSNGALQMRRRYQSAWQAIEQVDAERFAAPFGLFRFSRDPQGHVTGLTLSRGRIADIAFERRDAIASP